MSDSFEGWLESDHNNSKKEADMFIESSVCAKYHLVFCFGISLDPQ